MFYVGYRNPALLAKAATTLDHISGGRFELGIGAGWHFWEAKAYGYEFPELKQRLDMLDEAATIIRGMLTQERTTFHGKHFQRRGRFVPAASGAAASADLDRRRRRKAHAAARRQHADGWNAAYVPPGSSAA